MWQLLSEVTVLRDSTASAGPALLGGHSAGLLCACHTLSRLPLSNIRFPFSLAALNEVMASLPAQNPQLSIRSCAAGPLIGLTGLRPKGLDHIGPQLPSLFNKTVTLMSLLGPERRG